MIQTVGGIGCLIFDSALFISTVGGFDVVVDQCHTVIQTCSALKTAPCAKFI